MVDYTFAFLTTAVTGTIQAVALTYNDQIVNPAIETSNGTFSVGNISEGITDAVPGFLTGRRPVNGQLFPRGVYNK